MIEHKQRFNPGVTLSLSARRGSFRLEIDCRFEAPLTVLFGPSGAGKSTLLRLIAGLEKPDSGSISIHGHARADFSRPGRTTAMVTQQSALFPNMKVQTNVAYGVIHLNRETREQRVAQMLQLVGASHLAGRWPDSLSGGEAQRISLARALAPAPSLLLLDEPLSALDAKARDQILLDLEAWLHTHNVQTILVTHDVADALTLNAEIAVLKEGMLIAQGPANTALAAERQRILERLSKIRTNK